MKKYKNNLKISNAMAISLSIITLNINGLNVPVRSHMVADWIKKKNLYSAYKRLTSELEDRKNANRKIRKMG